MVVKMARSPMEDCSSSPGPDSTYMHAKSPERRKRAGTEARPFPRGAFSPSLSGMQTCSKTNFKRKKNKEKMERKGKVLSGNMKTLKQKTCNVETKAA